jgi:tape measure domain-containing protein
MANPIEIIKQSETAIDRLNLKLVKMDEALQRISQSAAKIPKNLTGGESVNSSQQKEINRLLKERQKVQKLIDEGNKKSAKIEEDREKVVKKLANAEKKRTKERLRQQKLESDSRKSLAAQKKRAIKDSLAEQKAIQSNREALQRQKRAMIAFNRPYNVLIRNHKKAKQVLQDATVKHGKNSKQVKQATIVYKKYQKQLNVVNKTTQNFANKGLRGLLGGFKGLLGAFGIVGGVQMFADFARSTIRTIIQLDRLKFTLQTVSRSQGDVARSTAFLTKLSLRFGAELISTTDRYVKFSVAARNAGLSAKQTEEIFGTVTKASAVLGLKTDELTGIYLALEQMLSKGKVTTEELRRQLGERLPGAFDLAAKALGTTTSELDKMLRNGEVLATDLLPKLRIEIDKAFGTDTLTEVNTLQTATTKLGTSWTLFIDQLNESLGIGTGWQMTLESLAKGIRSVTNAFAGIEKLAESTAFADYFKELNDGWEATKDNGEITIDISIRQAELTKESNKISNEFIKKQKELESLEKRMGKNRVESMDVLEEEIGVLRGKYKAVISMKEVLSGETKAQEELKTTLINKIELMKLDLKVSRNIVSLDELKAMKIKDLKNLYDDLQKTQEGTVGWYREMIKANTDQIELQNDEKEVRKLQDENVELQKKLDLLLNVTEETKKGKTAELQAAIGSIAYYEEQISLLEETRNKLSLTADEYMRIGLEIDEIQEKIDEIVNYVDATDILNDLLDAEELKNQDEELKTFFNNVIKNGIDNLADLTGQSTEDLYAEMKKLYGEDYQAFVKFSEKKLKQVEIDAEKQLALERKAKKMKDEMALESFELVGELAQTAFDRNIQQIDDEINRNRDYYSELLDNENLTEEQRSALEAERDAKERKLLKKKREEERKAAIVGKLFAISQIAIQAAMASAAALAPPPTGLGPVLGGTLLPFIIGNAFAQTAIVAAQPIPQYAKGKGDYDNYEGMAVWGEKRRELKISKDGTLELSPKKIDNHMTYVKKDDVIHPNANKFLSLLNQDSYDKQTYDYVQSSTVDSSVLGNFMMAKLDAQTNRMVSAIKNKKMSFKINQTLNVGEDLEFLNRQNNTL